MPNVFDVAEYKDRGEIVVGTVKRGKLFHTVDLGRAEAVIAVKK